MATYGWRQDRPVAEALFTEGHRFGFFQALSLLEALCPGRTPVGEGVDPRNEAVRLQSTVRLDFPATEIEEIRLSQDGRAVVLVNILGLAGHLGPLPSAVTELLLERARRRDKAFQEFLDIFNHRLLSLLVRAHRKYRPALQRRAPEGSRVATVLRSLVGLGTPRLEDRMAIPDRALLPYAGLLCGRPAALCVVERIIACHFGVGVTVKPFRGRWQRLEEEDTTRLGSSGQHQSLGRGAVLGRRVWDQAGEFEVGLGPLSLREHCDLLPISRGFDALVALVRFATSRELTFTIRLTLRAAEVPALRLSREGANRLGWTSWLQARSASRDDGQVVLRGPT